MKVVLFSIGTTGDIEPFLAIAEILHEHNCEIICVFPDQFKETVEGIGYRFIGYNKAFLDLIFGEDGRMVMGSKGPFIKKIKAFLRVAKAGFRLSTDMTRTQQFVLANERPDKILYHPKCLYSIVWGIAHPGQSIMVSPLPYMTHPSRDRSVMSLKGNKDRGQVLNLLSYELVNWVRAFVTYKYAKPYLHSFPGINMSRRKIKKAMTESETTLYTFSPSLYPKPDYWPDHTHVVGYYERNKTIDYHPESSLLEFIGQHQKIIFISFGSMINSDPAETTRIIVDILRKHSIPAIINISWGGLEEPMNCPDHIYFVRGIPYDWILPEVYAIIHHGGAGTTHSGIKYGCPTLIIPHMVDQFYWNEIVAKLRLGPKGFPIKKLQSDNFEKLVLDLLNTKTYKIHVDEIAEKMKTETDRDQLFDLIA